MKREAHSLTKKARRKQFLRFIIEDEVIKMAAQVPSVLVMADIIPEDARINNLNKENNSMVDSVPHTSKEVPENLIGYSR